MEIKQKNVLITGANRGIGRAVARRLAEDKAHLHLVIRKKDKALEDEMKEAGAASVTVYTADLADKKQINKLVEEIKELKVDILFNNAGVLTGGFLEKQSTEEIETMLQVNLHAVIHLTKAILPRMLQRKKGKIINNASMMALMHVPGATTYSASKAAIWAFTHCLRLELKGTGVTTLNLMTPVIKTRMFDQLTEKYGDVLDVPGIDAIPPQQYADMIREAILLDLEELNPKGLAGLGFKISKYAPKIFDFGIMRRFSR